MIVSELTDNDHLNILSSIIEYRCDNLKRTYKLLSKDLDNLYKAKSKRTQDKICINIAIKMDYIEILLSKIIDDVMLIEIIEWDNNNIPSKSHKKEENAIYQ
jgi:hypothetical protein